MPVRRLSARAGRVASIDIIRGAVMVLMAIDHVRVYSGLPAGGPTAGIFFTRWITHFCAPAFVFLAGTSAFLYGQRHGDLPRFLLTRGIWLVLLELTVIRVMWTFNFEFGEYMLAGVIWVIGWSMILLAALVRLPVPVVGVIGLAIVAGHNVLDSRFWQLAESLGERPVGGTLEDPVLQLLRRARHAWRRRPAPDGALLDCAVGRRHGGWLRVWRSRGGRSGAQAAALSRASACRPSRCFWSFAGSTCTVIPAAWGVPGEDGRPRMPALFAFLNTTKYPASLAVPADDARPDHRADPAARNSPWSSCAMAHGIRPRAVLLLSASHPADPPLAIVVSLVTMGSVSPWLFANHPMGNPPAPDGYTWSLGLLYLVWVAAVVMLYFPCRWFADLKARRHDWWLSYL